MLSFDLFGIGRRAPMQPERAETEFQNPKSPKPDNEPDQHDKDQEYELFFWSLYPVI
jgi:hypothetical protein